MMTPENIQITERKPVTRLPDGRAQAEDGKSIRPDCREIVGRAQFAYIQTVSEREIQMVRLGEHCFLDHMKDLVRQKVWAAVYGELLQDIEELRIKVQMVISPLRPVTQIDELFQPILKKLSYRNGQEQAQETTPQASGEGETEAPADSHTG